TVLTPVADDRGVELDGVARLQVVPGAARKPDMVSQETPIARPERAEERTAPVRREAREHGPETRAFLPLARLCPVHLLQGGAFRPGDRARPLPTVELLDVQEAIFQGDRPEDEVPLRQIVPHRPR